MAFQVSPGVNVSEIDLTTVVPATSTTEGAISGVFRWGPVNERILVSSEVELVKRFGKPHSALTETITAGSFETVVFDAFVMATTDLDATDTYTLTVGTETFDAVGAYTDIAELAADLDNAVSAAGITDYNISVNGDDDIQLVYTTYGEKTNITYALEFIAGVSATGNTDDTDPTITDGSAQTVSTASWSNAETFYTAADFLSYSDALYVVRVSDGNTSVGGGTTALQDVSAKYPGALGNSLQVEIIAAADYNTLQSNSASSASLFDFAPDTGNFHIAVVDVDGRMTGSTGAVLEKFTNLSATQGARDEFGANIYAPDVLEQQSGYITASSAANFSSIIATLSGGTDGGDESTISLGLVQGGFDMFLNAEEVDISFLIQGKARGDVNKAELGTHLIGIAESRRDCVAFVSPNREAVVNNSGSEATDINTFADALQRSTYAIVDSGYKYRYDKYGDKYVYTPLNGDMAGLCARTDDTRDPWFSPAGLTRGLVKNVVKLAFSPNKSERDTLYKKGVNPVITQAGEGTLLFGDKTFSNRPSAFDRINVRRLFIVLEKSIARAAKTTLFEFNDEFTRAQFKNLVEPFLRDVQGRRGIYDFRVVCDETNNTGSVVDRNEFVGDIYIKPARSINYIQLNFVAVSTGVEFSEVVGQA